MHLFEVSYDTDTVQNGTRYRRQSVTLFEEIAPIVYALDGDRRTSLYIGLNEAYSEVFVYGGPGGYVCYGFLNGQRFELINPAPAGFLPVEMNWGGTGSYGTDPKRTAVTGFSMGGVGTWHIGSRHSQLFTAAIPVAGRPAGQKDWKTPLYVIHAPADEVFPIGESAELRSRLEGQGRASGLRRSA